MLWWMSFALMVGLLLLLTVTLAWEWWKELHNPYQADKTDDEWATDVHSINAETRMDDTAGIDTDALNLWIDLDAIIDPLLTEFNQRIDTILEEWNSRTWNTSGNIGSHSSETVLSQTRRRPFGHAPSSTTVLTAPAIPGRPPNTWSPHRTPNHPRAI